MKRKEILSAISSLACSQGFYGRLYQQLTNGSEESKDFLAEMEKQNFRDTLDMVMWLEC